MDGKIECAFVGTVVREPKRRVSAKGNPWMSFLCRVGNGDGASWTQVSVFGECVEGLADLHDGSRVYVEGSIAMNEWTSSSGEKKHGLAVSSFKAEIVGRIGRQKPKAGKSERAGQNGSGASSRHPAFDDQIPI
jgi:single-stranded DNA-binding protein